jgi:hypothetical protein
VLVPNHNHAGVLPELLDCILAQTFRDLEVVVLDDASTDNSVDVIRGYSERADVLVVKNAVVSGSKCGRWLEGLDVARGEFVWIAEPGAWCAPDFVEALLELLRDPSVKVAYAKSQKWNAKREVVGDDTRNGSSRAWPPSRAEAAYRVSATQEVNEGFGVTNTMPSASALMFRRFAVSSETRAAIASMSVVGDWRFLAEAMLGGEVAYTPRPLSFDGRYHQGLMDLPPGTPLLETVFSELAAVHSWMLDHYSPDRAFEVKWEQSLRDQWAATTAERPFDEIAAVYPLKQIRARIRSLAGR